jgi:hypothetical protein
MSDDLTHSSSFLIAWKRMIPIIFSSSPRRIILPSKKWTREMYDVIDALSIYTAVKACTHSNSTHGARQSSKRLNKT